MNHLDAIEEAAGALPQSYQEVYDVYKTFFSVGNFESSSFSWKDNAEAQAAFETWAKAVIEFDAQQLEFSNYLYATSSGDGGFYFYQMNLDGTSRTTGYLIKYAYNNVQDNETEAGKNPSSVSYSTFISYSYSSKTAEWKADQNGATMLKAYQVIMPLFSLIGLRFQNRQAICFWKCWNPNMLVSQQRFRMFLQLVKRLSKMRTALI